mmetsp:Transcript_55158/g.176776  ORF Transcript_55158/g.176776 Transcript_55158/m.176776 type:complete len:212 (+) Transcript_55158:262-897(+)
MYRFAAARLVMLSRSLLEMVVLAPISPTFPCVRRITSRCWRKSLITSMPICSVSSAWRCASLSHRDEVLKVSFASSKRSRSLADFPRLPPPLSSKRARRVAACRMASIAFLFAARSVRYCLILGSRTERASGGMVRASISIWRKACSALLARRSASTTHESSPAPPALALSSWQSISSLSLAKSFSYSWKSSETVTVIALCAGTWEHRPQG